MPAHALPAFKLERFFDKHEFQAPHLLCCSDCEPLTMQQLLAAADPDTLQRWNNLKLSYTVTRGLPALREAISQHYSSIGPEQLLVCAPEEGIYLTMLALLKPSDHVVCMFPGYQSLYEVAQSVGCELSLWEPRPGADGQLAFQLEDLKVQLRHGTTKLAVVNFPHNPTGFSPSADEWKELVESVAASGAHLFSDEMYRFLEPDPSNRLPAAADMYTKAISLCGVSKSWGLPGLRIGWMASKDAQLLDRVAELKDYTTICSGAPSEVLALGAVRATDNLTQRCRDIIKRNVELVSAFFGPWDSMFEWAPPVAGPVAFPRLKSGDVDAFCEHLVTHSGVLLLPASVYEHAPSTQRGHFRIGLGREDVSQCLEALEAYMQEHYADGAAGAR